MPGPTIPKLNDTNYVEWSMLIEALLVKKNLFDVVSGEESRPSGSDNTKAVKAWKRRLQEAKSELLLNIELDQLSHTTRTADAHDIWESLRQVHEAHGLGTQMARRREFFTMKMKPDSPMARWIAEVRRASFLLAQIGGSVTEEDTIVVLANGLPPSYDNLVVNLDSTPADQLSLSYVVTRLLNEESRQSSSANATPAVPAPKSTVPAPDAAFAAHMKKRTPLSQITCFGCSKKGHYRSDCPDLANASANLAADENPTDFAWCAISLD
ncbi:hypothetical protein PHLCEN_2v953 [Hermanssonia centrifuga]|uniref:CCHC-type domain-containing protein n=1 Tax=Hermanssonia centrifuga TaxID=98765 RepID=A0A2R6S4L2_9APHY|nr:hypothetical protein PHLCEN_2v953 [Hermanssonia centrifuga]